MAAGDKPHGRTTSAVTGPILYDTHRPAGVRQNAPSTLSAAAVDDHGPRGGQQADDWAYQRGGGGTYDGDGRNSVRISASIARVEDPPYLKSKGFQNG